MRHSVCKVWVRLFPGHSLGFGLRVPPHRQALKMRAVPHRHGLKGPLSIEVVDVATQFSSGSHANPTSSGQMSVDRCNRASDTSQWI